MDEEYYVDLLNIYQKYFNDRYNSNMNMFDNINGDDELETNEQMEDFYDAIEKYKEFKEKNGIEPPVVESVLIDGRNVDELYGLLINDECVLVSVSLLSLIIKVSNLDWTKINWKIKKVV
jgi:hypothetical protein